jgi:capsule biosynthesis phosphatase
MKIVIDLDGTLTVDDPGVAYSDKRPNFPVVAKLREYHAAGCQIVIMTARNMRTFNESIGKINAVTLPIALDWLKRHDVPFDEIYVGKPWCGSDGFYVDDKAVRPSEFAQLSYDEIRVLLANEGCSDGGA